MFASCYKTFYDHNSRTFVINQSVLSLASFSSLFQHLSSDHGVEGRYPFLDESVVSFLNQLNVGDKCDLRLQRGLGEKLLLRGVAFKLGLRQVIFTFKSLKNFTFKVSFFFGKARCQPYKDSRPSKSNRKICLQS